MKKSVLPFAQVLGYLLWACCCGGSLAGLVCTFLFESASPVPSVFCFITSLTLGIIFLLWKKQYILYSNLAMLTLGFVCFPILYVTIGGVTSAFTYYLFCVPVGYGLVFNKKWQHLVQFANLLFLDVLIWISCKGQDMSVYKDTTINYIITFSLTYTILFCLTFLASKSSKRIEANLIELYEHDELTGLKNRYCVEKERSLGFPKTIAAFDIDHFKRINDAYLHSEGDKVLKQFANILKDVECDEIKVFRVGGEEFLLLSRMDIYTTNEILKKHIIDRVRKEMKDPGGNPVTVSCGICYDEENIDRWKLADSYLYMAKFGGRNQVVFNGAKIY